MLVTEDHPAEKKIASSPELKSEWPMSEKDEQGQAIEKARSVQKEALEKWNRLKDRIGKLIHPKRRRNTK